MDLNILWFALVTVLFTGFFVLEGFDFGVGILLPFLGKTDRERRMIINTIGPFWDGNEVWIITAGGAIFAAFPHWYATMFSGFYIALLLLLLAIIVRAVAFEFRSKDKSPQWRSWWDWMLFTGSFVPALLWGVALGNILRGVPIDSGKMYVGGFFNLLNPFALICGLAFVAVFTLYGSLFLSLKLDVSMVPRTLAVAQKALPVAVVLLLAYLIGGYALVPAFAAKGIVPGLIPVAAILLVLAAGWFMRQNQIGRAFAANLLAIVFTVLSIFVFIFPQVMPSSLDPAWSLTIYNASSSPYTLTVMSVVALIFVPIVLAYQGWSYWVFRERVTIKTELEY